jgi:hypothetical protein
MGEKESGPFQFTFDGFLKVGLQGSRVTSDAGRFTGEVSEKYGCPPVHPVGIQVVAASVMRCNRADKSISIKRSGKGVGCRCSCEAKSETSDGGEHAA